MTQFLDVHKDKIASVCAGCEHCNTALSSSPGSQKSNFSLTFKAKALSRGSELPPLSPPYREFCSFKPNTEMWQQNQQRTLHRQSKVRTTPHRQSAPGRAVIRKQQEPSTQPYSQLPYAKETRNQPPSSTHPNHHGLITASRTSAKESRERPGLQCPGVVSDLIVPYNSSEPHQPNAPFTTRFPSVVPCTTAEVPAQHLHPSPTFWDLPASRGQNNSAPIANVIN